MGAALIGLGTAAWHPPAMGALSARFPERRATALSIHGMGATISDTLTPLGVGALLVVVYWRDFLHAQLIAGIAAALLVWLGLARQFAQPAPRPSGRSLARDVRTILASPAFLAVSFADGLMAMARQVILTFLPLYIQIGLGRDAFELGVYVALLHGMGTVSQPVLGVLADRIGRKAVLVPSFLLLSLFYLLLGRVAPGWPLGLLVLAIGMFFYTLVNITTAAILDVAGRAHAGLRDGAEHGLDAADRPAVAGPGRLARPALRLRSGVHPGRRLHGGGRAGVAAGAPLPGHGPASGLRPAAPP